MTGRTMSDDSLEHSPRPPRKPGSHSALTSLWVGTGHHHHQQQQQHPTTTTTRSFPPSAQQPEVEATHVGDTSPQSTGPATPSPPPPALMLRTTSDAAQSERGRSESYYGAQSGVAASVLAGKPSTKTDPDVLYYGEELRLWACSEYALSALAHHPQRASLHGGGLDAGKAGGYVGIYFKGKKRKARTGQQPLACVPPIGPNANGELYESRMRCVDPHGVKNEGDPVRLGDELLLVDTDGHVWNTSTAGVVGYLTVRLRGERGELRVRFTRDLSTVNYKGVCYAEQTPGDDNGEWGHPTEGSHASGRDTPPAPPDVASTRAYDRQLSPRGMSRPRSMSRLRASPRSSGNLLKEEDRPLVRFGDALWLVSCPVHDESHPGAGRNMRKEHVLTNFKRETSSTLGGYLTVDPRGFALQFVVARAPPAVDVLELGTHVHYGLPWGVSVPLDAPSHDCQLRVLFSAGGAVATVTDLASKLSKQGSPGKCCVFDEDLRVSTASSGSLHGGSLHGGSLHGVPPSSIPDTDVFVAKFWVRLVGHGAGLGSVLVYVIARVDDDDGAGSRAASQKNLVAAAAPSTRDGHADIDPTSLLIARFSVAVSAVAALESSAARAVVASAAIDECWARLGPPAAGALLTAAAALACAASVPWLGWILCAVAWVTAMVAAARPDLAEALAGDVRRQRDSRAVAAAEEALVKASSSADSAQTAILSSRRLRGELTLLEWSPENLEDRGARSDSGGGASRAVTPPVSERVVSFDDAAAVRASDVSSKHHAAAADGHGVHHGALPAATAPAAVALPPKHSSKKAEPGRTEVVEPAEWGWLAELKAVVKGNAFASRWLEDGELLRFVRARKSLDERVELYREAMLWRRRQTSGAAFDGENGVYRQSFDSDPRLGSFGCLERAWCAKTKKPPAWWAFLSSNLPFELYGADRSGLPVTYLGLGRMDLAGVAREVGIERLEQKIVMQNDMFLDLARERRVDAGETIDGDPAKLKALHGGIFIIDCDGMARRHLNEVRIFKRVSAALKILHPERQRKTFVVRAPRVFSVIWRLIKPMLDARIISKINILGPNESLKPLLDELGRDNVPSILGGGFQLDNPPHTTLVAQGAFQQFLASYQPTVKVNTADLGAVQHHPDNTNDHNADKHAADNSPPTPASPASPK